MWLFNRRPDPAKAVEALQLFRVAVETFRGDAKKRVRGDAIVRHLIVDCLTAMLGRAPTEQEVARVCEDGAGERIPF